MPREIEFQYDFGSPNAYLVHRAIPAAEVRSGVTFRYVPVLLGGILGLGMLGMPAWYIHAVGLTLVVSRLLHATGLASSSGFSLGRLIGTLGTMVVYFAVAGALLVHAFTP